MMAVIAATMPVPASTPEPILARVPGIHEAVSLTSPEGRGLESRPRYYRRTPALHGSFVCWEQSVARSPQTGSGKPNKPEGRDDQNTTRFSEGVFS
jgi:hypothetical protein